LIIFFDLNLNNANDWTVKKEALTINFLEVKIGVQNQDIIITNT